MPTLVIAGTGLLGTSFGLAVKRAKLFERVIGVSSPAVVAKAVEAGGIDEAATLEVALPQADLVLLAQPVRRILDTLKVLDVHLRPGTLVTDVGSTKAEICRVAVAHLHNGRFVGGHPMAGREVRGPEGATADLFAGRPWVLTEPEEELLRIVKALGAIPVILDGEEHDRRVALSSHLPQLLSTALASYLNHQDLRNVAGPGILDMTRLALSSHELWADILATNAANVDVALAGIARQIESMRAELEAGGIEADFIRAQHFARSLRPVD